LQPVGEALGGLDLDQPVVRGHGSPRAGAPVLISPAAGSRRRSLEVDGVPQAASRIAA
jgi:hypothetical protein